MSAKKPEDEIVTLTRGDLEAMIKAGAQAALEAQRGILGVTPADASREQRTHAELGTPVPERSPHETTHQKCLNERNGARFTAVIAKSKTFSKGRVVDLIDYRYPDDIASRAKGMSVGDGKYNPDPTKPGRNGLSKQFLQWRYENYDKADRLMYVGQDARYLPRLDGPEGDPTPVKFDETARVYVG